jgi:hypothetical protein
MQDVVDVSGDFDGDGWNYLGSYRQSTAEWRIWTSGFNFTLGGHPKPTITGHLKTDI